VILLSITVFTQHSYRSIVSAIACGKKKGGKKKSVDK
jgi:hypothetical protein